MLVDRRRLGLSRPFPEDLETPPHQGMARAQNHLPLYQALHANMLYCSRSVFPSALHRFINCLSYRLFFTAVQFFDTNWTQEVRILRPTRRISTSDADARTLELQEDLLV